MRTCVGCRSRAVKSALLRVVAVGSGSVIELVPDSDGRLPGRGAYLHPHPGCLDLAQRRRALPRALRREGPLDLRALRRWFDEQGSLRPSGADRQDRKREIRRDAHERSMSTQQ